MLPKRDRLLLQAVKRVVPAAQRTQWERFWQAELWWRRYPLLREPRRELVTHLALGLCLDALSVRFACERRTTWELALSCCLLIYAAGFVGVFLTVCRYGTWYFSLVH